MGANRIHKIYVLLLVLVACITTFYFGYKGYSYYMSGIEDRFFHPDYQRLKSSGVVGHGLGIIGSGMIILGVALYMIRKRSRRLSRVGILSRWLEFHIFLCTLGPILVLYHTSFKFGGLVALSFWSMVAVVASGLIGRYIYLQIPHTIEGQEMNLAEIDQVKDSFNKQLVTIYQLDEHALVTILQALKNRPEGNGNGLFRRSFDKYSFEHRTIREVKSILRKQNITGDNYVNVVRLIKDEIKLNRKIDRLNTMQNLFKYWHVAHMPFAILMLIIMLVHVIVTLTLGYRWVL